MIYDIEKKQEQLLAHAKDPGKWNLQPDTVE